MKPAFSHHAAMPVLCGLWCIMGMPALAGQPPLVVIEDHGGASALPYYQALDLPPRQDRALPPTISAPSPAGKTFSEADMLPARLERLSPDDEPRRVIQALGLRHYPVLITATGIEPLMALPVGKPRMLLADKGYDGDAVRQNLLLHGILPVIPPRSNRSEPIPCNFQCYRDRNRIERMFNRLLDAPLSRFLDASNKIKWLQLCRPYCFCCWSVVSAVPAAGNQGVTKSAVQTP